MRRLVELHGGSVAAQSAGSGQGSEFIVRLPLQEITEEFLRSLEAPPSPEIPALAPGLRVLVVEDNLDAAAALKDVLELWGYEAEVVHSGKDAVQAVEDSAPAIILLDIGLPGMDGYEVARTLRARPGLDGVMLVALTGYGQDADRSRALGAGFDHHLTKPVDLDELRATMSAGKRSGIG